MRRIVVSCLVCVAAVVALPAAASAGTYVDWECSGPTGASAPAAGFTPVSSATASAVDACGVQGGNLNVGLTGPGPWQGGAGGFFSYVAPADTRIAAISVDRSTSGAPTGSSFLTYQLNVDEVLVDGCLPSAGCTGDQTGNVTRDGLNAASLEMTAGCGGTIANTCSTAIRMAVSRAAITLRDDQAPTFANVGGSLFAAQPKSGTVNVEFDAADKGGGVYRTVTTIDGQPYEVQPAATGTCSDVNPSNANPYEFTARVPCPLTQSGLSVNVDTTKLTDGVHTLSVVLEDAAGNAVNVIAPASRFTVRNAVPNGTPAGRTQQGRVRMWFQETRTSRFTSLAGRRVVTRGFLRDRRGRGIRGAEVEVYHYIGGRPRLLKTGLRSRRYGRLTLILPINLFGDARGRRRVAFYYRALRPGAITSRANLYLTIRNREGGPQTTPPDR